MIKNKKKKKEDPNPFHFNLDYTRGPPHRSSKNREYEANLGCPYAYL